LVSHSLRFLQINHPVFILVSEFWSILDLADVANVLVASFVPQSVASDAPVVSSVSVVLNGCLMMLVSALVSIAWIITGLYL
jgi:hypothetical protein